MYYFKHGYQWKQSLTSVVSLTKSKYQGKKNKLLRCQWNSEKKTFSVVSICHHIDTNTVSYKSVCFFFSAACVSFCLYCFILFQIWSSTPISKFAFRFFSDKLGLLLKSLFQQCNLFQFIRSTKKSSAHFCIRNTTYASPYIQSTSPYFFYWLI